MFGRIPGISVALFIPLAPFTIYCLVTAFGNARILSFAFALQSIPAKQKLQPGETENRFDEDFDEVRKQRRNQALKEAKFWKLFKGLLLDEYPSLSRTSRLPFTLGTITALIATDKDGILIEPLPQPEKVFISY